MLLVFAVYVNDTPRLYYTKNLNELTVSHGILREKIVKSTENTYKFLVLNTDNKRYYFEACDSVSSRPREYLRDKEVTLWHDKRTVYQASTTEKTVYSLAKTNSRLRKLNISEYIAYFNLLWITVVLGLYIFAKIDQILMCRK